MNFRAAVVLTVGLAVVFGALVGCDDDSVLTEASDVAWHDAGTWRGYPPDAGIWRGYPPDAGAGCSPVDSGAE